MLGERTGKRYRLGDRVKVKVVRVDMESTKIDFALINETKATDTSKDAAALSGLNVGAWGNTAPKKIKKAKK
jgi:ribonuclease R